MPTALIDGKWLTKAGWDECPQNMGEIRAAVDGRIGDKQVRVGQFVSPGTRMMTVVPTRFYVSAHFKENQIGIMRIGQPAIIKVDALPGVEFHGHVESLSPGTGAQFSLLPPQNATGNFTKVPQRIAVRIRVDPGQPLAARLRAASHARRGHPPRPSCALRPGPPALSPAAAPRDC